MMREYDHVKLHITVMNSLMRKDPSNAVASYGDQSSTRSGTKDRESFDATRLMQVIIVDVVSRSVCIYNHLLLWLALVYICVKYHLAVLYHISHKPSGRLPLLSTRPWLLSQPKRSPPWLVPNYTAWWQRHTGVCSLLKAITQWCPARTHIRNL